MPIIANRRRVLRQGLLTLSIVIPFGPAPALAQSPAPSQAAAPASKAPSTDPRVGLKPGLRDAGEAASNLKRIASLPKPKGFFDPKAPAGDPTPPERKRPDGKPDESDDDDEIKESRESKEKESRESKEKESRESTGKESRDAKGKAPEGSDKTGAGQAGTDKAAADKTRARGGSQLNFANSDLAFSRGHVFVGNFNGFNVYSLTPSGALDLVASVVCPGGQGDVSVHGNLLVMSVEQTRGRIDCGTTGVTEKVSPERFRGVRIFDISNLKAPTQVAAVQTCRGSHTHTLVTSPNDASNLYVYGSGTATVRSAEELAECSGKDPKEDPNTALFSIDVIRVPLATPEKAAIVNRPRIFADPATGNIAGLWPGGPHGEGTQTTRVTNQCHDITVFPEKGLAAGACAGNGILLDISNPVEPVRLDAVVDKNFAYWHSATFNNDGTKVVFTDEWGGGMRPRCRATDPPTWGANAIFDIVDRKLRFASHYKLPAPQTEQENCVAHNGSLIPVPGRDIMVQAWYQGGISVFDFTDSTRPFEIAFFDRGPVDAKRLYTGGFWSAYWYNGAIYGVEMVRGIDVFQLTPSEHLSEHEIAAARLVMKPEFNAQAQPRVSWPASPVVARAYLDQLTRSGAIQPTRAEAVKDALSKVERLGPTQTSDPAVRQAIETVSTQLEQDAAAAGEAQAQPLRSLTAALREVGQSLR
jgi:hypothetical protein